MISALDAKLHSVVESKTILVDNHQYCLSFEQRLYVLSSWIQYDSSMSSYFVKSEH